MRGTDLLAAATAELTAAGIPSPRNDAELLLAHALGTTRGELPLATVDASARARFDALLAERARRVPLQHLLGRVGFRYVELEVGPGVFVPRPETEVVVGWALLAMRFAGPAAPVVVDLCTGSGAIAASIAAELETAVVHAVEKDPVALGWARRNLPPSVALHHADARDALPELDGTVDLVISNPPYVALDEAGQLDPEVRDHDPHAALFAGDDGLAVIRDVAAAAYRLLKPGGKVVVEHSDRQGESAPEVLRRSGFQDVTDHEDWTGRPRYATGER